MPQPKIKPANDANIHEAARFLRAGRLIVFPTDTIYGLGSDATDDAAMTALCRLKERPRGKPLIVLLAAAREAKRYARLDRRAERLTEALWPGPLSLVLPRREDCALSPLVSAGTDSVALRVPDNSVTRALIRAAGRPLAAPSANPSGQSTPARPADIAPLLGQNVALILDAGPANSGLASTILDLTGPRAVLLREGAMPAELIEAIIGPLERVRIDGNHLTGIILPRG